MAIIATVGSRSLKVRAVYGAIYLILLLGALTMIWPLVLMLSGSIKSSADFNDNSVLPKFLWDDRILWTKYLESKYTTLGGVELALNRPLGSWRTIAPPSAPDLRLAEQFRRFRSQFDWRMQWHTLGFIEAKAKIARNARWFIAEAQKRYHGDLDAYCRDSGVSYKSWSQVGPPQPPVQYANRRFTFPQSASFKLFYELSDQAPRRDWIIIDPDASFGAFLRTKWATIDEYNDAHGTHHTNYRQVLLPSRAPKSGIARDDWETFVRQELNLSFIRLASPAPPGKEPDQFVRDPQACPLDSISLVGSRQAFEDFLKAPRDSLALPIESVDWLDFNEQKAPLRWELVRRNYLAVFDYILLHGTALRNTLIFCVLLVLSNLVINPLCAYALSRYRPPSTYAILLFCMATMAFPAEVTMIPSFLLLRRFPFYALLIGSLGAALTMYLLTIGGAPKDRAGRIWRAAIAIFVGILATWLAPPLPSVSLLNTFWALVLPGAANGFSIFLLKGFFDSLPQELYEAAEIDGATEWHKFWIVTMSLSKPILAVLALGAFTTAYSEFMMALVIIPDSKMWTIMVWLFQLQQKVHPSVVYASLVVAAIPTLLVFLLCQNLIMRGIVVPTEK